jgi:hypothetical protein
MDLSSVRKGQNSVRIESRDLIFPEELNLRDIEPRRVTISVDEKPSEPPNQKQE